MDINYLLIDLLNLDMSKYFKVFIILLYFIFPIYFNLNIALFFNLELQNTYIQI